MEIENVAAGSSVTLLLASKIVRAIEESGAAKTEVIAAIGVVQCLLPTMEISSVPSDDVASFGPQ